MTLAIFSQTMQSSARLDQATKATLKHTSSVLSDPETQVKGSTSHFKLTDPKWHNKYNFIYSVVKIQNTVFKMCGKGIDLILHQMTNETLAKRLFTPVFRQLRSRHSASIGTGRSGAMGPNSLLYNRYRLPFPGGGEATGAWRCIPTII